MFWPFKKSDNEPDDNFEEEHDTLQITWKDQEGNSHVDKVEREDFEEWEREHQPTDFHIDQYYNEQEREQFEEYIRQVEEEQRQIEEELERQRIEQELENNDNDWDNN